MIERLIYTALKDGIAALTADLERLPLLFGSVAFDLEDGEVTKIKEVFAEQPPSVVHSYPRADSKFPLFAVVLGNENESTKFMDDYGGFLDSEEAESMGRADLAGAEILSSLYQHTFHVLTYTKNPDQTLWYYQIAKYLLTRQRGFFKDRGLLDTQFSGHDMSPSQEYVPEWLFARRLTMTCSTQLSIIDAVIPRIRSVDGIYVTGTPDVQANVIPYDVSEE